MMERCRSFGESREFARRDWSGARHGIRLGDTQACREFVAQALDIDPASVQVNHCDRSPSNLTLRSRGQALGTRFFSKTYLVDTYPLGSRFVTTWEERREGNEILRSAQEQIALEWINTRRMGELAGCAEVPQPIGKSVTAKTIVWEEAAGLRVDRLIRRSAWWDPRGRPLVSAVLKAGAWLARVHRASALDRRSVDLIEVKSSIRDLLRERELSGSRYGATALRLFVEAIAEVGSPILDVPLVFAHGDFNPSNLIWDGKTQRLGVVDFELAGYRDLCHDLIAFLFSLRIQLLNPFISPGMIRALEDAFWEGYGAVPRPLYAFVSGITAASVFYYYLPRVSTRGQRRGWRAGLVAFLYKTFLESSMVTRRLGVPKELWEAS